MISSKLRGVSQVFANMRRRIQRDASAAERGLKAAGLFLIRESLKVVPVEHGVLKSSWFVRLEGSGFRTKVFLGYTANYAIYVHENLDAVHGRAYNQKYADDIRKGLKFRRGPNQQAKFLEGPIREKRAEALAIIKARMAA